MSLATSADGCECSASPPTYPYSGRNPAHFSVVAEFATVLAEDQLRAALDVTAPAAVELTVHRRTGARWRVLAGEEVCRPFHVSTRPSIRAILANGDCASAVLLTFDQAVADANWAITLIDDLVAALNGDASSADVATDPRLMQPRSIRPLDAAIGNLHTVALDAAQTAELVNRSRAEGTTVHAAIAARPGECRRRDPRQVPFFDPSRWCRLHHVLMQRNGSIRGAVVLGSGPRGQRTVGRCQVGNHYRRTVRDKRATVPGAGEQPRRSGAHGQRADPPNSAVGSCAAGTNRPGVCDRCHNLPGPLAHGRKRKRLGRRLPRWASQHAGRGMRMRSPRH
jgi:hypothetical protein